MAETPPADHVWSFNGWQIGAGFAGQAPDDVSRHFYALYAGETFDAPERGLIAAVASAHPANEAARPFARDAAQLLMQSFAEGFFSARRTLSPRRAVVHALAPINRWLAAQAITQPLTPVSLTALNFQAQALGVIHIGAGQLYRQRAGAFLCLAGVDAGWGQEPLGPARAIGTGAELVIDYLEEQAEPGDRFIILAGFAALRPEAIHAAADHAAQLPAAPGGAHALAADLLARLGRRSADAAAMVIDVIACPAMPPVSDLAALPLRPEPREGALWDGFLIGRTVYRGRYTILKAARDTIMNRDVVLKIPLRSMLTDEIFAAGFVREAWIGATARGSAIARYIDIPAERRNSLYLVLPHYPGETLEARLHRQPAVSLPEGMGIALQLCEAIGDLAALQIIHRDIKPDNIMILPGNALRLLDLGLAYLPGIDRLEATKPGGTIRYMAPELLRGQPATARSEVYSLAITLYRMFTGGAYPFGQREQRPLARLRPDLPAWLGLALQRALSPKPEDRFADATALAATLQLALTTAPEDPPASHLPWRPTILQAWQTAAIIFAAASLFLLLRSLR